MKPPSRASNGPSVNSASANAAMTTAQPGRTAELEHALDDPTAQHELGRDRDRADHHGERDERVQVAAHHRIRGPRHRAFAERLRDRRADHDCEHERDHAGDRTDRDIARRPAHHRTEAAAACPARGARGHNSGTITGIAPSGGGSHAITIVAARIAAISNGTSPRRSIPRYTLLQTPRNALGLDAKNTRNSTRFSLSRGHMWKLAVAVALLGTTVARAEPTQKELETRAAELDEEARGSGLHHRDHRAVRRDR